MVLGAGCVEWLEMDLPEEGGAPASSTHAPTARVRTTRVGLPKSGARVDAKGPIVPRTPGLRVPEGYFTRVRIDEADRLLPYTWVTVEETLVFEPAGPRTALTMRLVASNASTDGAASRALRGVVRIAVPGGTTVEALAGLSLGAEALVGSTLSVPMGRETSWLVTPTRLELDEVRDGLLKGSIEGEARRGSRSTRMRRFRAGFVALRAPAPGPGVH